MTSRPHDALFKAAFETPAHAAALFRALLPKATAAAINWSSLARESGSFIDPKLEDRHSDLLFSADIAGTRALLYLLLEHQSTVAPDMPLRMGNYLFQIWARAQKEHGLPLPLILPGMVCHAPGGWTGPRGLHEMIEPTPAQVPGVAPLVPNYELLVLDLTTLDDLELRSWALGAFPLIALVMLRDGRDPERLRRDFFKVWRDVILEVLGAPSGAASVAKVFRYVALVTRDVRFEDLRATIQNEIPEANEIAMTIAEQLREEGLQQGHTKMLLKQLTLRFGELSPAWVARVESASVEALERYIERVLTADSLELVFVD